MPMESRGDGVQWEYAIVDVELEWDVRSKTGYYLLHLNYLWAVPVDVVTAPLLWLLMVMTGASPG